MSVLKLLVVVLLCATGALAQDRTKDDGINPVAASKAADAIDEAAKAKAEALEAAEAAAEAARIAEEAADAATEATEMAQQAVAEAEASGAIVENADAINWTGSWRSFWRGGQALLTLEQNGSTITGGYQPGEGTVTGVVEGMVVRGTWAKSGNQGGFEFALAPDGQSFVGRSGNGEYWNGERLEDERVAEVGFGSDTPKAALISLMSAANAAAEGDSFAEFAIRRYLTFLDSGLDLRSRNGRIAQLLRLIDLSTFRALVVPETGLDGKATFEIGPAGTDWTFPLEFVETDRDTWKIVVPPLAMLDDLEAQALASLGVSDFDELSEARKYGPRQTGRDFMRGTATWNEGGEGLALSTLDMSEMPENLRSTDGPLAAEYIRQIIDRVGYSIWQEVPDDPDRRQPYVVYEHALGDIALARYPQEDGTVRWLFTPESLAMAPAIYEAMQNLPLAAGVSPREPLTRMFKLRSEIKDVSPRLLKRPFLLENWQWIAIAALLLVTLVVSWFLVWLGRLASVGLLRIGRATPEAREAMGAAFGWPARVFAAGVILTVLLPELGLRQDVSAAANRFASLFMLLGGTFFVYRLVDAATAWLAHSASKTTTHVDDIAVGLGGGLVKVAVVVGGVVVAAEVLGLPYEGVIAGLGVGGLALAIASKDAVSNFIGAGILASDRPFKKGDLIEAGGLSGVVEHVGLRSTRLRGPDGTVTVVPNAQLSDGQVNNYGRPTEQQDLPIELTIGVAHDTPRETLDALVDRLRAVFAALPLARPDPKVALVQIGPASIDIGLSGRLATQDDAAFQTARHRLVGDIVALAHEMEVRFANPTSAPRVAIDLIGSARPPQAVQTAA